MVRLLNMPASRPLAAASGVPRRGDPQREAGCKWIPLESRRAKAYLSCHDASLTLH